jgi:hypothetical protein
MVHCIFVGEEENTLISDSAHLSYSFRFEFTSWKVKVCIQTWSKDGSEVFLKLIIFEDKDGGNLQEVSMSKCIIPYDCFTNVIFQRCIGNKFPKCITITTYSKGKIKWTFSIQNKIPSDFERFGVLPSSAKVQIWLITN